MQLKRQTRLVTVKCECGKRITKYNRWYYENEFNDLKPICKECIRAIKEVLDKDEYEVIK